MKKGLAVLGATVVGGLATGVLSGMVVNEALKYKPEDLERDLAKKDAEAIKKSLTLKDKVITVGSFTLGIAMVALGGAAASSAVSDARKDKEKKEKDSQEVKTIKYHDRQVTEEELEEIISEGVDENGEFVVFEVHKDNDQEIEQEDNQEDEQDEVEEEGEE